MRGTCFYNEGKLAQRDLDKNYLFHRKNLQRIRSSVSSSMSNNQRRTPEMNQVSGVNISKVFHVLSRSYNDYQNADQNIINNNHLNRSYFASK